MPIVGISFAGNTDVQFLVDAYNALSEYPHQDLGEFSSEPFYICVSSNNQSIYPGSPNLFIVTVDNIPIGTIELSVINQCNNIYDIGIHILKDYANKGYGTQAIIKFLEFITGIQYLKDWNRIHATIHTDNIQSAKAFSNAGFAKEGILRSYLLIDKITNKYHDAYMFSITKENYLVTTNGKGTERTNSKGNLNSTVEG